VSFAAAGGGDDPFEQCSDRSDSSIKGLRGVSPYEMTAERVHFDKQASGMRPDFSI
jgi:hypothetical protein